jgi:hypothetical protein
LTAMQEAVRAVYALQARAADAIVCDPEVAVWFAAQVNKRLSVSQAYPVRDVMRCLLNMRKAGKLPPRPRPGGQ